MGGLGRRLVGGVREKPEYFFSLSLSWAWSPEAASSPLCLSLLLDRATVISAPG